MSKRSPIVFCPNCGTPHNNTINVAGEPLSPGVLTVCINCEISMLFPAAHAIWFERVSEIALATPAVAQLRAMQSAVRAHKMQQGSVH